MIDPVYVQVLRKFHLINRTIGVLANSKGIQFLEQKSFLERENLLLMHIMLAEFYRYTEFRIIHVSI